MGIALTPGLIPVRIKNDRIILNRFNGFSEYVIELSYEIRFNN